MPPGLVRKAPVRKSQKHFETKHKHLLHVSLKFTQIFGHWSVLEGAQDHISQVQQKLLHKTENTELWGKDKTEKKIGLLDSFQTAPRRICFAWWLGISQCSWPACSQKGILIIFGLKTGQHHLSENKTHFENKWNLHPKLFDIKKNSGFERNPLSQSIRFLQRWVFCTKYPISGSTEGLQGKTCFNAPELLTYDLMFVVKSLCFLSQLFEVFPAKCDLFGFMFPC